MSEFEHTTVLLQETVDELNVVPDGIYGMASRMISTNCKVVSIGAF